ncbi:MAG: hypothetical protein U1E86_26945 [Burkholderiaceae bacterium]
MRALLHVAGCLAVLPYAALAGFFLFVDRAAAARSLPSLLELALAVGLAVLEGGGLLAAAIWLLVAALGVVPVTRRLGSAALGLVAAANLVTIVTIHAGPLDSGQVAFLAPCASIVVLAAWSMLPTHAASGRGWNAN